MIKALVVEDDTDFAQSLTKKLLWRGFDVQITNNVSASKHALIKVQFDYVFIDLMLPPNHTDEGIVVLRNTLRRQPQAIPMLMTSREAGMVAIVNEARDLGAKYFFDKNDEFILENIMVEVERFELEKKNAIFLSHGHSELIKFKLKDFLRHMNRKCIVLSEQPSEGMTVVEKLERNSKRCFFAIIVLTKDDEQRDGHMRARQNVVHELGFFQGMYGRRNVVLLVEQSVELFTNISGIVYIEFDKQFFEACYESIRREIEQADTRRE